MAVITLPSAYTKTAGLQYQGGDSHFRNTGLSRAADDEPDTEVTMENGVYTAQPL